MDKRVLATLLSSVFITLTGIGIIAPILPLYANELGATGVTLGLMIAGFSVSRGILQPFVGGWSDKHGKKLFLVAGLTIYAVMGLLYTVAGSVGALITIRTFHGVGSAMVVPIAMAYVGDLAPVGQEGRYMGMLNIALFAGIGSGPLIGGLFVDTAGMETAFYAMAGFSGIALALVVLVLPGSNTNANKKSEFTILTALKDMIGNRRVLGVLISRMATMMIMIPTMAFLPLLMAGFMDATGSQIGIVIAIRTLVNAVLQTPFGRMVDRYAHKKLTILLGGSAVIVVVLAAVAFVEGFPELLVLFGVLGAAEAVVWPTLGAYAIVDGQRYGQGAMMGVFNMSMSAGILAGSVAAGGVMDLFGIRSVFITVAAVVALMSGAAGVLIRGDTERPDIRTAGCDGSRPSSGG